MPQAPNSPPLLDDQDGLPHGWQKCLRKEFDAVAQEIRYVPSRPLRFVMMALCFLNTFSGTFLVPHCKNIATFFGKGPYFAAFSVCAPYLTNMMAVYASKWIVPSKGWLVATLISCGLTTAGTLLAFVAIVFEPLRSPWVFLLGGMVFGMGQGQLYIGRQLGVETSSVSARNKIFAQQTVATSLGIVCGTSTSGLTTLASNDMDPFTLAMPFLVLCVLAVALAATMIVVLPNRIVKVPVHEAVSMVSANKDRPNSLSEWDSKVRIWATILIGFNRVVVRSTVENETTAVYQKLYGYPEVASSSFLSLAYVVGVVALQLFGLVHDRLTDRTWIYITLALIMVGSALQFPIMPEWKAFEVVKFTVGLCMVLPGLALNTAVANSTATKYAIPHHWLYTQEMIGMLQIVTQTSLARIVGPFLGYVLAIFSLRMTIVSQAIATIVNVILVFLGIGSNLAETAKGRANLKNEIRTKEAATGA